MKIGFDLWGTLIKPNPLFRERRIDLIKKYMPGDPELVSKELDAIKHDLNRVIEYSGWQPTEETILNMFTGRLNISYEDAEEFMKDYQRLALIYSPSLYDETTFEYLEKLSKLYELYLVSNTMFLTGETLSEILNRMGVEKFFKSFSFSDQMGDAKPSIKIHRLQFDYFVGDSTVADEEYANRLKSKFILINKNNQNLEDVHDIITSPIEYV